MKDHRSELSQYLRRIRNERGCTLNQVFLETKIDPPLISKLESGERLPTPEQIIKLASHYKISERDLKVKVIAEKIIKKFGINDNTYDAIQMVLKQLKSHTKK